MGPIEPKIWHNKDFHMPAAAILEKAAILKKPSQVEVYTRWFLYVGGMYFQKMQRLALYQTLPGYAKSESCATGLYAIIDISVFFFKIV